MAGQSMACAPMLPDAIETKKEPMVKRPAAHCPIARALELIGDRWTLLILRDLHLEGPQKFHELQESVEGIGPTTLSDRLKVMLENGIVERRFYSEHPPRGEYLLTGTGKGLLPVLKALKTWGQTLKS
jgi:DNA-binding HxlR family transcriptional regulator